MVSWITEIAHRTMRLDYAVVAALLFLGALISSAIALTILIRLPPDYFRAARAQSIRHSAHGMFFPIGILLKNLFGVVLILLGVILSIPGLPGQGLLTVLAGVLLLDFPGKRRLLYRFVSRPLLLQLINRLRTRFSQRPLVID